MDGHNLRSRTKPSPSLRSGRVPTSTPRSREHARPAPRRASHPRRAPQLRVPQRPDVIDNLIRGAFLCATVLAAIWILFGTGPE